jgi:nickel-dependent lactate racemase
MKYRLSFGRATGELTLREPPRMGHFVGPARTDDFDLRGEVRRQLHDPLEAPPLYRACTADDRIAVVFDASLPQGVDLLVPLFETIASEAGVSASNISVVYDATRPAGEIDRLIDELPDEWADVQLVGHRPDDAQGASYLASTASGKRVYLARTVIDADLYLVVSRIGFDSVTGRRGPSSLLFPVMSNEQAKTHARRLAMDARLPADQLRLRQESQEVSQLAGLFFALGASVGADGMIDQVWFGRYDAVEREGDQYSDRRWRVDPPSSSPDLVIAVTSPQPGGTTWETVAGTFESAVRLLGRDSGGVAVISDVSAPIGSAFSILRQEDDPWRAANQLRQSELPDAVDALQLASAIGHGRIYFLSKLDDEIVESMGMVPLRSLHEVENLAAKASRLVLIENADRFEVTLPKTSIYRQTRIETSSERDDDEQDGFDEEE